MHTSFHTNHETGREPDAGPTRSSTPPEHRVLALQRTIGNRATAQLLAGRTLARDREGEYTASELQAKYAGVIRTVAGSDKAASDFLSDCIRIRAIISDRKWMINLLKPLEFRVEALYKGGTGEDTLNGSLRTAFREREQAHGFKQAELLPLDVLPGRLFVSMMMLGFAPPKDPGAGLGHGEWTHRLQWNALMTDYDTDGRHAWRNRPIDVYKFIGDPRLTASIAKGSGTVDRSLVGYLMDAPGQTIETKPGQKEKKAKPPTEGFRRPDDVTWIMRHDKDAIKVLPAISAAVSERFEKRIDDAGAAAKAGKSQTRWYKEKKTAEGSDYTQVAHPNLLVQGPLSAEDRLALEQAAAAT